MLTFHLQIHLKSLINMPAHEVNDKFASVSIFSSQEYYYLFIVGFDRLSTILRFSQRICADDSNVVPSVTVVEMRRLRS